MKKNFLLGILTLAACAAFVVFGVLLMHFQERRSVYLPAPYKPAHPPEVTKDTSAIDQAMAELATDKPEHPGVSGAVGERAVFQRNFWYHPTNGSSWETKLKDVKLSTFALSSKENFVVAVERGLPGSSHPGLASLTSAEWDSVYAEARSHAANP